MPSRAIGERLDAPVVFEGAAIEDDFADTGLEGALSNELAHLGGGGLHLGGGLRLGRGDAALRSRSDASAA